MTHHHHSIHISTLILAGSLLLLTALPFTACQRRNDKTAGIEAAEMIGAASEAKDYDRLMSLADSLGNLVKETIDLYGEDKSYNDKQWARYKIFQAISLEGLGRHKEAESAYDEYQQTRFSQTMEGLTNAPIGVLPGLEFKGEEIESIKGRPLFVYTDGLNEAENPAHEQFGDERLLKFLRGCSFESARQVIEGIAADVETHRNGAEPNDDLTMMCLNVKNTTK